MLSRGTRCIEERQIQPVPAVHIWLRGRCERSDWRRARAMALADPLSLVL
jgi:hypothetical protein